MRQLLLLPPGFRPAAEEQRWRPLRPRHAHQHSGTAATPVQRTAAGVRPWEKQREAHSCGRMAAACRSGGGSRRSTGFIPSGLARRHPRHSNHALLLFMLVSTRAGNFQEQTRLPPQASPPCTAPLPAACLSEAGTQLRCQRPQPRTASVSGSTTPAAAAASPPPPAAMGQLSSKPERRLQKLQAMKDNARTLLNTWQQRAFADLRAGVAPGTPGSALAVYDAALEHYEQAVAEERALVAHLGMWRNVGLLASCLAKRSSNLPVLLGASMPPIPAALS